jgi:hypothetical protein
MNTKPRSIIQLRISIYDKPHVYLNKLTRKLVRKGFGLAPKINRSMNTKSIILYHTAELDRTIRDEIQKRLEYYLAGVDYKIIEKNKLSGKDIFSDIPVLFFGITTKVDDNLCKYRPGFFNINYQTNPMDGWAWIDILNYFSVELPDFKKYQDRLANKISFLKNQNKQKCYIFGTGPTLSSAIDRNWEDGYRIVCNTIVKDPELWNHLHPEFIVAGDAIYHFGHTKFADAFRNDLRKRLAESDALFIYPAIFHNLVKRELAGVEEKLIPIPSSWRREIDIDLTRRYSLPNLGNVLGLLLLPLACTLSDNICLWGFDGRNPSDKLFWSNSEKHSYPEYMQELVNSHPAFFSHYVPAENPTKYVESVQGDQLDQCLRLAEMHGRNIFMMHHSWTPTLEKRYIEGEINNGV